MLACYNICLDYNIIYFQVEQNRLFKSARVYTFCIKAFNFLQHHRMVLVPWLTKI